MPLYKYFSADGALRFFRTGMVRFTQPAEFNDPFELRPHITGLADADIIAKEHSIAFQHDSLERQIYESLNKLRPLDRSKVDPAVILRDVDAGAGQVMEFVRAVSNGLGPILSRHIPNLFNDNLGIFCLTEDPMNLLMWAHYGDHHRGVVIQFDDTHAFFNRRKSSNDDLRHFRRVDYSDTRFSGFLTQSDAVGVFYTKSRDWEYEREWRLIAPLADAAATVNSPTGYPIALFEVPGEAVRCVFTGCRVNHTASYELARLARSQTTLGHVTFNRVELHQSDFALVQSPISTAAIDDWLAIGAGLGVN